MGGRLKLEELVCEVGVMVVVEEVGSVRGIVGRGGVVLGNDRVGKMGSCVGAPEVAAMNAPAALQLPVPPITATHRTRNK